MSVIQVCIMVIENCIEHGGKRAYRCNICEYTCSKFSWAKNHLRIHTGEKPFECKFCGRKFTFNGNYWKHYKYCKKVKENEIPKKEKEKVPSSSISKKKKYAVPLSFVGKKVMHDIVPLSFIGVMHDMFPPSSDSKKIPLEKKFKCNICGEEFLDEDVCEWHSSFCSENLKTQKVLETFLNQDDSWLCSFCGKKFEDDQIYLRHSASCNPPESGQTVKDKQDLEVEIKSLKCDLCGKVYENEGIWMRHINYCNSKFKTQQIVEDMLELNEKTLECYFCHEKFANEVDCRNHQASCSEISNVKEELGVRDPEDVGTFKCEFCGKEFKHPGSVKRHSNLCKYKFKTGQIVDESNEKTLECRFCNNGFANETDFRNHSISCDRNPETQLAVEELLRLGQPE